MSIHSITQFDKYLVPFNQDELDKYRNLLQPHWSDPRDNFLSRKQKRIESNKKFKLHIDRMEEILVYELNNEYVGVIEYGYNLHNDVYTVENTFVHPQHRHKKIGSTLMKEILLKKRDKPLRFVCWTETMPFYGKLGCIWIEEKKELNIFEHK